MVKASKKPERIGMKVMLDERVVADLKDMADSMGLSLNQYIRVVLGQHVIQQQEKETKK